MSRTLLPIACLLVSLHPDRALAGSPIADDPPGTLFSGTQSAAHPPELSVHVDSFEGMILQEADHFNGFTVISEQTYPLGKRERRLRVRLPLWTSGTAVLTQAGDEPGEDVGVPIDLWGVGAGVWTFPTVLWERPIYRSENERVGLLWSKGVGINLPLTAIRTTFGDLYNHQGVDLVGHLFLTFDPGYDVRIAAASKVDFFVQSDDLDPSDRPLIPGIESWFLVREAASILSPALGPARIGAEARYATDLAWYHSVASGPEIIVSAWRHELKLGALIGITDDAERYRVRVAYTVAL